MKLPIIIPTYNSASVLPRALDSIVGQTFTDWEVLVMDGASTDDTLKVAQSYNDSRIHINSEPDKGIYNAMNKGVKKAHGEWLYFLGSDDWLIENEKKHLDLLSPKSNTPIVQFFKKNNGIATLKMSRIPGFSLNDYFSKKKKLESRKLYLLFVN